MLRHRTYSYGHFFDAQFVKFGLFNYDWQNRILWLEIVRKGEIVRQIVLFGRSRWAELWAR